MKGIQGEKLQNTYLTLRVNSHQRRLYFRDVRMYMKVHKRTLPPLPSYSLPFSLPLQKTQKPNPEGELTETEEKRE